jgi:hypothetical protein
MKHFVLIFSALFALLYGVNAQTVVFTEDFEGSTLGVTSSSTGSTSWALTSQMVVDGTYADSATVAVGDTISLTTDAFSTLNNFFVELEFDHIAKIAYSDAAEIYVSNDNGATWTKVTGTEYLGTSQFGSIGNKFTSTAYPLDWDPANAGTIDTSWFKTENFNLSALVSNSANVKIRFDLMAGAFPLPGYYGWVLDNIKVTMAPSELIPPVITMVPPIVQDTVYGQGPYDVSAYITDNTALDTAVVVYTVLPDNITTTIGMNMIATDTFMASIPFPGFGRTIQYYVKATDASNAANMDSSATYSFFCKFSTGGTYQIGSGTATNSPSGHPCPYANYYWGNREQYLILASELTALGMPGGPISSITFDVAALNSLPPLNNFEISMGHTSVTSLSGHITTGLTTVYSPTAAFMPVVGLNTHQFATNFVWDGTSNIVIQICSNNSSWVSSGNATVNGHTTTFASTVNRRADQTGVCAMTGTTTYNQRPNIGLEVQGVNGLPNDIGVYQITNPTGGVLANQNFDVTVNLKNFGIDTVTSATIDWLFDGVAQTQYTFSDSLKADSVSADIILGTKNVALGTHTISAWSSNPNGSGDNNIANDTANFSFYACSSLLNGTYTIGGTNPDFNTFADAVLALDQCGINGPVTFNVASGTYIEQFELGVINGASATNTVTFKSTAGDSSLVILKYDATGSQDNYVVKLDGASYLNFEGISFVAEDSTYARVFVLKNTVSDIAFDGVVIENTIPALLNNDDMELIHCMDTVGHNFSIQGSLLKNGSRVAELRGKINGSQNWEFKNNQMIGHRKQGLFLHRANSAEIINNFVFADTISSINQYFAIRLIENTGSAIITNNVIQALNTLSSEGIYLMNSQFDSINPALIANNFVQTSFKSGANYSGGGIRLTAQNVNVYYNNTKVFGNHSNCAGFRLYETNSFSKNINIVNNNFVNFANSFAIVLNGIDSSKVANHHNNLYSTDMSKLAKFGSSDYSTIADWQLNTGDGVGTVNYDPYYVGANDLHIINNLMNGTGTPIAGITHDIDGDLRNLTTPDIGADEFDPSPYDVTALELLTPYSACGLTSTETVTIRMKNVGSATINGSLTAKYQVVGNSTVVSEAVTSSINSTDTFDFVFATPVDLNVLSYGQDSIFNIIGWLELSGDPIHNNDTAHLEVNSQYQPPAPTTAPATCNYGQSVNITAISNDSLYWFASMTDSVELAMTSSFNTGLLYDTTTFYVEARSGGAVFKLTETVQFKTATGATSPYPSYLPTGDFDGVEISNLSSGPGDLAGYTINVYVSASTQYTYTFPAGTTVPGGTVALAVYGSGLQIGPAGNNVFYINSSTSISSSTSVTYWLTDPSGVVVDAFGANNGTFPASSGVTPADFSGNLTGGGGKPGAVRILSDNNVGTDWQLAGTALATFGSLNPQLPLEAGSGCASARIPLQVNVIGFPTEDAGISLIVNPSGAVPSGTSQIIKAEISNFGTSTLTSAKIPWTINGMPQDTFQYVGSIPYQGKDTVHLDTTAFAGGVYTIKAWTIDPNNVADTINTNDTTQFTFNACLNGTYTIGDTTGGAVYDFPSVTAAVFALNNAGVCGHVVFNIDTGVYTEQVTLNEIFGAGPTATITFQSITSDSTDVTIQYQAMGTGDNWVFRLDDADYVTVRNIHLKAMNSSYATVLEVKNGATYNTFEGNILESAGTSSQNRGIYDYNTLNHYNTYRGNKITGGYYGIYTYGINNSTYEKGTVIENNDISGFYYAGIFAYYQDSVIIHNNKIYDNNPSYGYYGIYSYYNMNGFEITNNSINLNPSGFSYALRIYYGNYYLYAPANAAPGLVANNMVNVRGGSTNYGLYAYYSNNVNYYYNTVKVAGGSGSGYALYQGNTTSNTIGQTFYNNIFYDSTGTYAAYFIQTGTVTADYNNYYSISNNLAYWGSPKADLAALQAASATNNQNSMNVDPLFMSTDDLHLQSVQLSGYALPLSDVTTDIDGEMRSAIGPTIGADEVPLLPFDLGATQIFGIPDSTYEAYTYPLTVEVKNFGTTTIQSYHVEYTINGGTPVSTLITDSIMVGQIDTVSLGNITSPAGNSIICATTVYTADTNFFNNSTCKNFFGIPTKDAYVTEVLEIEESCGMTTDTIKMWVKNIGIDTINGTTQTQATTVSFVADFGVGQTPTTETFSTVLAPGDSVLYVFNTLADFTNATQYDSVFNIAAWINYIGDNVAYNDTAYFDVTSLHIPFDPVFTSPISLNYGSPVTLTTSSVDTVFWYHTDTSSSEFHTGASYTTPFMYFTDTFWVEARAGGAVFKLTETVQFKTGSGYTNPYPSYLPSSDFDGVEITNLSGAAGDLAGYTINVYVSASTSYSYTFPPGSTVPGGTVALAIYGSGLTVGPAGNNVFNINSSTGISSSTSVTYWLTDPSGVVVDAFGANAGTFPPSSGVTALDFTGNLTGGSGKAGSVRIISDNNVGTDWQLAGTAATSFGSLNPQLPLEAGAGCSSNRLPYVVNVSAQPNDDVGILRLVSPTTAVNLTGAEDVTVRVKNFGLANQTNIDVAYQIDSGTVVWDTIPVLNAGDSLDFTFTTTANLGIGGNTYSVKAYTDLGTDVNHLNDTVIKNVTNLVPNYCASTALYTSYQDIAGVTFGGVSNTSPPPYNALYTDYTALTPGMIAPGNTYPITIDIQYSSTSSSSAYVEVYIDYNRDGVFTEPDETAFGASFNSAGPINGTITVPNNALVGNTMMRIVAEHYAANGAAVNPCGTYTYGETEDYTIMVAPKIPQDAGAAKVITPSLVALNSTEPLLVEIRNYGSQDITSVDISYELNGAAPVTITHTNTIFVDSFENVNLGNINLAYGTNSLCVYTTLTGDNNTFNDMTCVNIFREATVTVPYIEDFESQNLWFNDTLFNQWEFGNPGGSTISAAHSGNNAWVTKLDTFYTSSNSGGDLLYTPKIEVTGLDSVYLRFWHQMNVDGTNELGMLQASVNGGPYAGVGYIGDANGTNWFNTNQGGSHGWRYANQAWQQSEYVIDLVDPFSQFVGADTIQFRFLFSSNGTSSNEGWAIDDFEIELPMAQIDAGVLSIDTPTTSTPMGATVTVKITVNNYGLDPLSTIDVNYQVGSNAVVSETFTPAAPLASGASAQYEFTTTYVAPTADYTLCAWTSVTGDAYATNDQKCNQLIATAGQYDAGAVIVWPSSNDTTSLSYHPHVYIDITNYGTETLTSIPVMYDAAGTVVNATWTGSLAPGATVQYMFDTTYNSPLGNYNLCVETQLPNDVDPSNDKECQGLYGEPVGIDNIDPSTFVLNQNQPNPASQMTIVTFDLPTSGDVRFELRNSLGQLIMVTEDAAHSGQNTIEIDASTLNSGVYYYSVEFNGVRKTLQMVVTK